MIIIQWTLFDGTISKSNTSLFLWVGFDSALGSWLMFVGRRGNVSRLVDFLVFNIDVYLFSLRWWFHNGLGRWACGSRRGRCRGGNRRRTQSWRSPDIRRGCYAFGFSVIRILAHFDPEMALFPLLEWFDLSDHYNQYRDHDCDEPQNSYSQEYVGKHFILVFCKRIQLKADQKKSLSPKVTRNSMMAMKRM